MAHESFRENKIMILKAVGRSLSVEKGRLEGISVVLSKTGELKEHHFHPHTETIKLDKCKIMDFLELELRLLSANQV